MKVKLVKEANFKKFTKSRYEDCTVCVANIYCEDHKKMAKDLGITITPLDVEIYY